MEKVRLAALKVGDDGKYHTYVQDFNNRQAAERAAESMRKEGYEARIGTPNHLYRNGAASQERRKFEKEYGKKKGDYVYGAVVGKVRREQLARRGKR
jgi:hypothetical protein